MRVVHYSMLIAVGLYGPACVGEDGNYESFANEPRTANREAVSCSKCHHWLKALGERAMRAATRAK